jgi:hypothetical protein
MHAAVVTKEQQKSKRKSFHKMGEKVEVGKGGGFRSTRGKGGSGVGQQRGASPYPLSRQSNTHYCLHTHTHTPTFIHFVFCTFAAKKPPTATPHIHTSTVHTDTLLTTNTLPKPIKLSLSLSNLSFSLFFSASSRLML